MTYATEVLADTPWAYWKLGEASGTFADSSGNARTMSPQVAGSTSYAQAPIGPGLGNSVNFNGISGVYGFLTGNPGGGDVTIEWVFKPSNLVAGSPKGVIDFNNDARMIRISDTGQPGGAFQLKLGTTTLTTTGGLVANGNAYHCAATYTSSTGAVLLYVNGTQVYSGTTTTTAFVTGSGFIRLPWNNANGREIAGPFSDVAIYQSVLSPTRISAHFLASGLGSAGSAALSQTSTLTAAGARTAVASAALTQTSVLSAHVAGALSGTAALTQTSVLTATATTATPVNVTLGPWVADQSRSAGFVLGCLMTLSVLEADDPLEGLADPRHRVSETYPTPTLVNGRPT